MRHTTPGDDGPSRSLDIAARAYWWRPAQALNRAFMLEAYARAGFRLEPPVADLGCGTGLFAAALSERGVLARTDVGLDHDSDDLRETVGRPRLGLLRGDLRRLPFAPGSLGSALANAVLSSFVGGDAAELGEALAGVRGALRPGGLLVSCVATPAFARHAGLHRAARRLGRDDLARRAEAWISRRNDHTLVLDRAGWTGLLEGAGFAVEACRPVMGRGYADLHRRLALARGADLPRRLGLTGLAPAQGAAQAWLLRATLGPAFAREVERLERAADPDEAGFLLIAARATPDRPPSA